MYNHDQLENAIHNALIELTNKHLERTPFPFSYNEGTEIIIKHIEEINARQVFPEKKNDLSQKMFLTPTEVEQLFGVSRTTLWRLDRDKTFPKKRRIGKGTVRYVREEIEDWIKSR